LKLGLLRLLVCPTCQDLFHLQADESDGDELLRGRLACRGCGARYPVVGGIPRILPPALIEEQTRTADAFGWEWTHFSRRHGARLYIDQFLDWIAPLSIDDVRGKMILDGGCGMGRFAAACSDLGAKEVVAVDISNAVEAAYENTRHLQNVHIVQADIYNLPLRKDAGDFDFVFSIGVLHHLPDPEVGFCSLVRHLKPGGTMAAWVYGYENNEWLVQYVNPIRLRITSRLPHSLLYALSFAIALPLHLVLKLLYAPVDRADGVTSTRSWLPYKYLFWLSRFSFRHTHLVIFDHLVAPKADYLKRDEFAAWFDRAGLVGAILTSRNENGWRGNGRKPGG